MDTWVNLTWTHQESDANASLATALAVANAGRWAGLSPEEGARSLRALLVASLYTAQAVGRRAPPQEGEDRHRLLGNLRAEDYEVESRFIASALARTPQVLLPASRYSQTSITTLDGGAAQHGQGLAETFNTAGLPVIVIVVAITAAALSAMVLAERASAVVESVLAKREATRALLASQANALQLVERHMQQNDAAQRVIPWTPEELELFRALTKQQQKLVEQENRPLPEPFPGASKALEAVGSAVSWILPVAVVAGGLFLLQTSKGR